MAAGPVAFVLGGGGVLGAVEVGMLRALFRAGIQPDMVLGTSIGAVNGALVAADPTEAVTDRLVRLWASPEASEVYGDSVARQLRRFAARTHLHSPRPLRRLLETELGVDDHLRRPAGAVPLLRRAHRAGRRALVRQRPGGAGGAGVRLGAGAAPTDRDRRRSTTWTAGSSTPSRSARRWPSARGRIFVLQVGRIERELTPPRRPWEIAQVAFEIARRHRFFREMAALPEGVEVHVLPTGGLDPRDDTPWAYRDMAAVGRRISRAYTASRRYLATNAGALMPLPPRWLRRLLLAPAVVLLAFLVVTTLPVWALLARGRVPAGPGAAASAAAALDRLRLPGLGRRRAARAVPALGRLRLRLAARGRRPSSGRTTCWPAGSCGCCSGRPAGRCG